MRRLKGKVTIVVGSGHTPGTTTGNGRATTPPFPREGARVLAVDANHESADETARMLEGDVGEAFSSRAGESREEDRPAGGFGLQPNAERHRAQGRRETAGAEELLVPIPLRRFAEGPDLSGAAIYLASRAGSFVMGVVLPVDGGHATTL